MILASQSPRRRQLLEEAGFTFRCVPSDFDERSVRETDPRKLVAELARGKASAVAPQALPDETVVGSDTVVAIGGAVLGKPTGPDDARRMLRLLSGKVHEVATGVSVQRDGAEVAAFTEVARVEFWDLEDAEIDAYVASGEPADKAGAYGIQGRGRLLVKRIEGDYYTIVGLPVARLYRVLRDLGEVVDRDRR